jgi:CRISPR-associated exonuclease Cas4
MFAEDELLPISALQHLIFCERQWALIHLEQQWAENRLTAEGCDLHEIADSSTTEFRDGIRIARGLALRSLKLGITGRADVVEFSPAGPHPVEYKRGKPKPHQADQVQLCAQALCLEEMLATPVLSGDLFYGEPRRRYKIELNGQLRATTLQTIHPLSKAGTTPPGVFEPKCRSCSLIDTCQPRATQGPSALAYLKRALQAHAKEEPPSRNS